MKIRTAELICTGDELLNGAVLNTHARTLGGRLDDLGVVLLRYQSLGDERPEIAEVVRGALNRADLVFVTGGLGPTRDDITREAVADALGRGLETDEVFERAIRMRYKAAGFAWTDDRARQALRIQGGQLLKNPVGSAPAHRLELDWKGSPRLLFVLPGPPREFDGCLNAGIMQEIAERSVLRRVERVCMLAGIGESEVERMLVDHRFPEGVSLKFRASPMGLELRLSAAENGAPLAEAREQLGTMFGDHLYADERLTLPEFVTRELLRLDKNVCTAESCTAGWLGKFLTELPGSSSAFLGGIISYSNEVKEEMLGVPREILLAHGAVSEPVAEAMAAGARKRFASDYALSITGIAGPGGGTETKPVGLVYTGIAGPDGVKAIRHHLSGDREHVRLRAAMRALELLRLALRH